jgi:hypothetical protein
MFAPTPFDERHVLRDTRTRGPIIQQRVCFLGCLGYQWVIHGKRNAAGQGALLMRRPKGKTDQNMLYKRPILNAGIWFWSNAASVVPTKPNKGRGVEND